MICAIGKDIGALISNVGSGVAVASSGGGGGGATAGGEEATKEEEKKEEKKEESEEESDDDMGFGKFCQLVPNCMICVYTYVKCVITLLFVTGLFD